MGETELFPSPNEKKHLFLQKRSKKTNSDVIFLRLTRAEYRLVVVMALKGRDFFTIVEFGTSKICALHGGRDKGGTPTVFGSGSRDSAGCIVKGEIVDLHAATAALAGALEDADNSAGSTFERERVYYLVSGRGITSRQGEGNVMLYGPDRHITEEHVEEAIGKASRISLAPEQMHIESFTSYYMLDMNTGWDFSQHVFVTFPKDNGPTILENDRVTIYGEGAGTQSYTTVLGAQRTIPKVEGAYVTLGSAPVVTDPANPSGGTVVIEGAPL